MTPEPRPAGAGLPADSSSPGPPVGISSPTVTAGIRIRTAVPADYDRIAPVLDAWWGRPVLPSLPRLFLDHFHGTSLIAERAGARGDAEQDRLAGFLIGFPSGSLPPERAYLHFVGVAPDARAIGLGRQLYQEFFARMRALGCRHVSAITAPSNAASIAFHRRLGFTVSDPIEGYNGPGTRIVRFDREL